MLLYRVRLRPRAVQELLAVMGIAVGVGLLFASQIASTSLDGSVRELVTRSSGDMRFQLAARSPQGFDQSVLRQVQRLPGVLSAMPVLEQRASLLGPRSGAGRFAQHRSSLCDLARPLLRHFTCDPARTQNAVAFHSRSRIARCLLAAVRSSSSSAQTAEKH